MKNPFPPETRPELVTIRTFSNEFEAIVAKTALEAAGIDCMISSDDCGGQRPSLSLTQCIRLVVKFVDADRAEEVLAV
jgi:hypothetical protein